MTSPSHILSHMNTLNFTVIYWTFLVCLRIFHGSTVAPFKGRRFRAALDTAGGGNRTCHT